MKVLSLFANVGFSEFYLNEIGFNVVVANELESDRCDFYKKMHPNTKKMLFVVIFASRLLKIKLLKLAKKWAN